MHYSRSSGGQASTSKKVKGPREMFLTFTFVLTVTLESFWAFAAIILHITHTTTKFKHFLIKKNGKYPTDNMTVLRTAEPQLTLTVQAEYVRPFLVSFQHPPLLISHRPDPEAKNTHVIVQKVQKAPLTYNNRKCQKMNLVTPCSVPSQ